MKRITSISIFSAIVVVCCIIAIGYTMRFNKVYDYKQAEAEFEGWQVGAKLIGSEEINGKEIIKGSPYELFFWIKSRSEVSGTVKVTKVELREITKNAVAFKGQGILKGEFDLHSDNMYSAYFEIRNVDLEYVRYMLVLKFVLQVENSTTEVVEKEVKLYFERDYKEYRSNKFLDEFTSV